THLGSAGEVLLLSFVLADRINALVSEKLMIEKVARSELENSHQYLKASHRLKDDFLGTISQDFIVPIKGVLARVNLLNSRTLSEEQNSYVNTIIKSARSMMFLVEDLLRFTEKTDSIQLVNKSFQLRDELDYIRLRCWAKCQTKGLEFQYYIADNIPERLMGDVLRLHAVLYNLLDNAVKFTEKGCVTFSVSRRLATEFHNKAVLEFNITDTGQGIPEDKLGSIFKPFSLIDATATRAQGGLGIGLALCHKNAKLMDAEIKLSSQEAKGTEVKFTVKFDLEAKEVFEPLTESVLQVSELRADIKKDAFKGYQILIAEDNPINQIVLKKIVEKLGCIAFMANDGNEAIKILKGQAVDMIFMDCQMPNKNGYEATKEIRTQEATGVHLPIIAVTANAMIGDEEKCRAAGMDDYLKKPVKLGAIKETLEKYL
ncbi:MAG: response regulator, partial [Pseudomonadales bacterium]|nr:response regulator [Pseudomonadales bacterium]